MTDSSTKVIGFLGSYKGELLGYLSRILIQLDYTVAIVDGSQEQYLKWRIPELSDCDYVNYRGVDIIINGDSSSASNVIYHSDYDVVLVDIGFNEGLAHIIDECEFTIIVSDYEIHNVMRLKSLLKAIGNENQDRNAVKLYKDIINSKINEKYVDSILKTEDKFNVVAKYKLYLNEEDYRCRLLSGYDDVYKFKGLSKGYITMLKDIVEELYNTDKKELLKAIKLARRGA